MDSDDAEGVRARRRTEDGDGGPHDDEEAQPSHSPSSLPRLESPPNLRVLPRLSPPPHDSPPQHTSSSPLLTLPPELLTFIALHLATRPPNLGPPSALLPLLRTCRALHARIAFSENAALWGAIGRAKFALPVSPPYPFTASDPWHHKGGAPGGSLKAAAHALRTHCAALSVLRSDDIHAPGAGSALVHAYGMLVSDRWGKAPLGASREGLPPLPEGLGSASGADKDEGGGTLHRKAEGKNRRQLAWAGAREFALRFVRERLYEGRYGEADPRDGGGAAVGKGWRVGWPQDTDAAAAALWVLWFFEGWDTLRAEPEAARRALMALLLPFVVAPFRYPSALCPPHHYSVPLLPSMVDGPNGEQRAITVATLHGAYPVYALGPPEAAGVRASPPRRQVTRRLPPEHVQSRSRLLIAPPARLLFFARMQAGGRMGVPPHLARDRAEAQRWATNGGTGPQPIGPTQDDIHEKNARPVVRFERQLPAVPVPAPFTSTADPSVASISAANATAGLSSATSPTAPPSQAATTAAIETQLAVPFSFSVDQDQEPEGEVGEERWAAHAWRARLCRRYDGRRVRDSASMSAVSTSTSSLASGSAGGARVHGAGREGRDGGRVKAKDTTRDGRRGAAPGRIGRVYELGSFTGLWAGTMLMPSKPPYTALLSTPGGAFPSAGLVRDDFVVAARPVYMRIAEHQSFQPHTPVPPPPPDSTTGEEGMRAGWLPRGTRVLPINAHQVEVRVDPLVANISTFEAQFGYTEAGDRREEEKVYVYETVGEGGKVREDAHVEGCVGCVRAEERARWAKERWTRGVDVEMEEAPVYESSEDPSPSCSQERSGESLGEYGSASVSGSSSSPAAASSPPQDQASDSAQEHTSYSASFEHTSDSSKAWPEWDAPAWAGHRFVIDEGWEGACDGVQDVVFTGSTDPQHGMAWHHYEYAGRVRPWDGLIGLVMRPRDRTLELGTYFISGHLVGRDTFEGTWQIAAQDVLAPTWGGSVCLARGEE
ncbi:hypothetical protein FB451DRAFT_1191382 [Mycena latifolia]|nr:hypothetical protein FB451DRAFT_1191382 [Mycena latifolia]